MSGVALPLPRHAPGVKVGRRITPRVAQAPRETSCGGASGFFASSIGLGMHWSASVPQRGHSRCAALAVRLSGPAAGTLRGHTAQAPRETSCGGASGFAASSVGVAVGTTVLARAPRSISFSQPTSSVL